MVWSLFATQLERADTLEGTNLLIYAPALYSTADWSSSVFICVYLWLIRS